MVNGLRRCRLAHIQAPLSSHQMLEMHGRTLMQSWHAVNAFLNLFPAAPLHLSHLSSITRPPNWGLPAVKSGKACGRCVKLG